MDPLKINLIVTMILTKLCTIIHYLLPTDGYIIHILLEGQISPFYDLPVNY